MIELEPKDADRAVGALANIFYKVIPREYRTYCTLTATLACEALKRTGLNAEVVPSQVWLGTGPRRYVVGFVGAPHRPKKWDGHVVCICGDYLFDAALQHFHQDFGIEVPEVAVVRRVALPSQVMATQALPGGNTLEWLQPPQGVEVDFDPPAPSVIEHLVGELTQYLLQLRSV